MGLPSGLFPSGFATKNPVYSPTCLLTVIKQLSHRYQDNKTYHCLLGLHRGLTLFVPWAPLRAWSNLPTPSQKQVLKFKKKEIVRFIEGNKYFWSPEAIMNTKKKKKASHEYNAFFDLFITPILSKFENTVLKITTLLGFWCHLFYRSVQDSGTTTRSLVDTCRRFGERKHPLFSVHYLFG